MAVARLAFWVQSWAKKFPGDALLPSSTGTTGLRSTRFFGSRDRVTGTILKWFLGSDRTTMRCLESPAVPKHSVSQAWRSCEQRDKDCGTYDRRRDATVVFPKHAKVS